MSPSLLNLIADRFGERRAVERVEPRWTFADVVLPASTRRGPSTGLGRGAKPAPDYSGAGAWGSGMPPASVWPSIRGTAGNGKDHLRRGHRPRAGHGAAGRRYAELESMWMGETPKNVAARFRMARRSNVPSVLSMRPTPLPPAAPPGSSIPHQREANTVVNVLLRELEAFNGVVIFATNLAANFDPAFERRIRTHVRFECPASRSGADLARPDPPDEDPAGTGRRFPTRWPGALSGQWRRHQECRDQGRGIGQHRVGERRIKDDPSAAL